MDMRDADTQAAAMLDTVTLGVATLDMATSDMASAQRRLCMVPSTVVESAVVADPTAAGSMVVADFMEAADPTVEADTVANA